MDEDELKINKKSKKEKTLDMILRNIEERNKIVREIKTLAFELNNIDDKSYPIPRAKQLGGLIIELCEQLGE